MQCSVEECPNPPLAHGLCSDHSRILLAHHHPMTGRKNGADVTMAGQFFDSLSTTQPLGVEKLEQVLPVVRVPFIRDEATFKYHNYRGAPQERTFSYKPKPKTLTLREELVVGIRDPNVLDRPIVFLVATNIPHTGIYILYGGQFYSVAYGYDTSPAVGSLYSIDIPLIQFSEARIVWIGILTDAIMGRLQHEFDRVTDIVGNFKDADVAGQPRIVDRLMFFHIPRAYGGVGADSNPDEWNCTKWAMHILFGDRMPANFRDLVSRTNPGLTREYLTRWLTAYGGSDQREFIRVLKAINNASFPRSSRGSKGSKGSKGSRGGRRMTKKKTRKMHKYY